MLRNLADKFSPTDVHRKQEVKLKWQQLTNKKWSKGQDLTNWLHNCEATYNELIHFKVKTRDDTEPIYDFLNALDSLDSSYTHTKRVALTDGSDIKFCQLLSNFRNYHRSTSNMRQIHPQHGSFPILQG